MNRAIAPTLAVAAAAALAALAAPAPARACTSYLVTRGASADGSVHITYAADSHTLYGDLPTIPPGVHPEGETIAVHDWDSGKYLGRIRQAPRTYAVVGNLNEHQVAIGETTWGGRKELKDPAGIVDYGSLMFLALQRARTAREAIDVMAALVDEYGYASSGESFSIADPNEAWILELIGKGEKRKGAVWVAMRVPDGMVSAHANHARIGRFPLNDPKNCVYAKDVIRFARDQGWFSGKDEEFSFTDTYNPLTFSALRACESRVWSFFRRVAPGLDLPPDAALGKAGAKPLPLWIKPERKLGVRDVMELMRDHFEGTPLDLSVGVGAGPFNLPYRWRPMHWEADGKKYVHERSVSTQQTGFSFVSQSRAWLPGPIGGVLWFGVDDTYSTVYVPVYAAAREAPAPFAVGNGTFTRFSWDSAFWVFNFVANWAYSRYRDMIVDIRAVQAELDGAFVARQPDVEAAALALWKQSPELARDHLTRYSDEQARRVLARWRALGESLIVKYMDGNVRSSTGEVTHPDYPVEWRKRIVDERGESLRFTPLPGESDAP